MSQARLKSISFLIFRRVGLLLLRRIGLPILRRVGFIILRENWFPHQRVSVPARSTIHRIKEIARAPGPNEYPLRDAQREKRAWDTADIVENGIFETFEEDGDVHQAPSKRVPAEFSVRSLRIGIASEATSRQVDAGHEQFHSIRAERSGLAGPVVLPRFAKMVNNKALAWELRTLKREVRGSTPRRRCCKFYGERRAQRN